MNVVGLCLPKVPWRGDRLPPPGDYVRCKALAFFVVKYCVFQSFQTCVLAVLGPVSPCVTCLSCDPPFTSYVADPFRNFSVGVADFLLRMDGAGGGDKIAAAAVTELFSAQHTR